MCAFASFVLSIARDSKRWGSLQENFVCVHAFRLLNLFSMYVGKNYVFMFVFLDANSKRSNYLVH